MADWFKFYENDLDEERLQLAMSEQAHVGIVLCAIKSRCCREKLGTIPWTGKDYELFALANKLHISPPIANQCLEILQRLEIIKIASGTLTVLDWNRIQSEYCQSKSKQKLPTPESVPRVSRESRKSLVLEERRREENKEVSLPIEKKSCEIPSLEEVKLEASKIGLAEWKATDWFHKMDGEGWKSRYGHQIGNWRSMLVRVRTWWESEGRPMQASIKPEANGATKETASVFWQDKARFDLVEKELTAIKARASHTAMDVIIQPQDRAAYAKLQKERANLRKKLNLT